jgi:hypothetical protein
MAHVLSVAFLVMDKVVFSQIGYNERIVDTNSTNWGVLCAFLLLLLNQHSLSAVAAAETPLLPGIKNEEEVETPEWWYMGVIVNLWFYLFWVVYSTALLLGLLVGYKGDAHVARCSTWNMCHAAFKPHGQFLPVALTVQQVDTAQSAGGWRSKKMPHRKAQQLQQQSGRLLASEWGACVLVVVMVTCICNQNFFLGNSNEYAATPAVVGHRCWAYSLLTCIWAYTSAAVSAFGSSAALSKKRTDIEWDGGLNNGNNKNNSNNSNSNSNDDQKEQELLEQVQLSATPLVMLSQTSILTSARFMVVLLVHKSAETMMHVWSVAAAVWMLWVSLRTLHHQQVGQSAGSAWQSEDDAEVVLIPVVDEKQELLEGPADAQCTTDGKLDAKVQKDSEEKEQDDDAAMLRRLCKMSAAAESPGIGLNNSSQSIGAEMTVTQNMVIPTTTTSDCEDVAAQSSGSSLGNNEDEVMKMFQQAIKSNHHFFI